MFENASTIISKEFILKYVSEEDIFKKYLGLEPTERGSFINPLRNDHSPGCGFYIDARGAWKFHDVAAKLNWDCFNVVEYDYGLTFKEALIRIAIDFNLVDGSAEKAYRDVRVKKKRPPLELRVKRRKWYNKDYAYWAQFGITPERLEFFAVFPLSNAWFLDNGQLNPIYFYNENDPCYAYHFGGYDYKLYFPLRTSKKFIHLKSDIIQGYNQLPQYGENFLFTKSFKDVMCIDSIGREFDLCSGAPMAETIVVTPEQFSDVYNRFDNLATLFDLDRTGVYLARLYKERYELPSYFFGKHYRGCVFGKPIIKDFADFRAKQGEDNLKRLVEQFIKRKNYEGEVF